MRSSAISSDDLFGDPSPRESLGDGAVLLRGFALPPMDTLLGALHEIITAAPWRHMSTPGGFRMSVAMSNCGHAGWVSDRSGYRYDAIDPMNGKPWPAMPECFAVLAASAAAEAGFSEFTADACLINRYDVGARMTLHQDKNERDFTAPIVSVSLGIPAVFLFGGLQRSGGAPHVRRVPLIHGDVVVWGGAARLRYHGVQPLKDDDHVVLGRQRVNLTFRKAL